MEDKNIIAHIDKLASEEHELFQRESSGKASDADQKRLAELETMLDQCWDMLRQRRAKREFGQNPGDAELRDAKTVKNYIG
ncbi:MAG: DUF2630 family protein [Alphaproteobacteria bacterium]|nr:DUF2630 family protein [Alphaproteobacteria bacterium]